MTVQWNGRDRDLKQSYVAGVNAALQPLPYLYSCTCGKRTDDEQWTEYYKGRDPDGNIVDAGAVVTHAKPDDDPHVAALASDWVVLTYNITRGRWIEDWSFKGPAWEAFYAAERASPVLHGGIDFPEGETDEDHNERYNWRQHRDDE